MNLPQTELVARLTAALPAVEAVYLFGSADTPDERGDSDVDLAYLSFQTVDPVLRWEYAQELATWLKRDVDLIDLREASAVMRAQVVAHGRRLYCRDETVCARFEDSVFSAYARLNESRREILQQIAHQGRIHA